ncbi:hypothetical protein GQ457_06G011490 [Hibiscus cannabinus]
MKEAECPEEKGVAAQEMDAELRWAEHSLAGPVIPYQGLTVDVIMYRGSRRNVRLLNEVIRSVQSPAEVLSKVQCKVRGRQRPRKGGDTQVRRTSPILYSDIVDVLITDSDFNFRQSATLWEAKATMSLNVRGLGVVSKHMAIQALLRKHEVEMALFHETKLATIIDRLVKQSLMIVVYVLCVRSERRDLWVRLLAITSAVEVSCCLGGDFNKVTSNTEHHGCVGDRGGLLEFVSFIHDGGLVDFPTAGKVFTWYGSNDKGCRLDRFLVSADWLDQFEGLEQHNLSRNVSDHDPRISEAYRSTSVVDKLRELKVFLKQWNLESFGCVETQIEAMTTLLKELDDRVNELDDDTILLRRKVQDDLWRLFREGSKAPGPNGYSMEFFKAGWSFLRDDVMGIFDEFYRSSSLARGVNSSYVVLIPKKDGPRLIREVGKCGICWFNASELAWLVGKGDNDLKCKMSRVGWSTVYCLKRFGGLGVVDLRLQNLALLAKWAW